MLFVHGMCGDADVWADQARRFNGRYTATMTRHLEASVSSVTAGLWHPAQSRDQVRTMLAPVTARRSRPREAM